MSGVKYRSFGSAELLTYSPCLLWICYPFSINIRHGRQGAKTLILLPEVVKIRSELVYGTCGFGYTIRQKPSLGGGV